MADELDELVLKVGVQVDSEQLKKLRDEIKKMQTDSAKGAAGLGLIGGTANQSGGGSSNYGSELTNILKKSSSDLASILSLLKKEYKEESNSPENLGNIGKGLSVKNKKAKSGLIPFVQDLSHMSGKQIVGGTVGAGVGAAFGNAALGAELGGPILAMVTGVFDMLKNSFTGVTEVFQKRLEEDIHFDKLGMATGKTREDLALLSEQARLSAYSLDALVQSNQSFADEMITGISPQKAQLMMALGINPNALMFQAGGDPAQAKQLMFEQIIKSMKGQPAAKVSQILRLQGFGIDEQYARSMMNDKDVRERAKGIVSKATLNGTQPFLTHSKLREQNLSFTGYAAEAAASKRAAATSKAAEIAAMKTMEVTAGIMNVIANGAVTISTLGESFENAITPKNKSDAQKSEISGLGLPWMPSSKNIGAPKGSAP